MENIHPGHALLRKLVPDTKLRREIVKEMCELQNQTIRHRMNLFYHTNQHLSDIEWQLIVDFIDSI